MTLYILRPKSQYGAPAAETDDRQTRTTPRCVIAHPGPRYAEHFRDLFKGQEREASGHCETVYKSKLRPWAKTAESESYVPLPARLAEELLEWRVESDRRSDSDFNFPNSIGGFMDYENFEARQLDPIRKKLGLPKLNFQVLRRTFATRAYGEKKGTLKDVQLQLRHTRPDTTLENYVKDIPDSVYQMVDLMYDEITRTREGLAHAEPTPPEQREVEREALAQMAVVGGVQ